MLCILYILSNREYTSLSDYILKFFIWDWRIALRFSAVISVDDQFFLKVLQRSNQY